ncbi:CLUMA_CG005592, isoform A [Clunio marinus]|uniref:CLUMA_CG005592, isoform A n=1 Tax=Clunio marinus TaxID=568069 RepID=A0A1J1HXD6_9DIPT|nr:CLUMA_CG005592, isoform A [Clunio marinus]
MRFKSAFRTLTNMNSSASMFVNYSKPSHISTNMLGWYSRVGCEKCSIMPKHLCASLQLISQAMILMRSDPLLARHTEKGFRRNRKSSAMQQEMEKSPSYGYMYEH